MTAPKMELRRPEESAPTESGWYYGIWSAGYYPDLTIRPFKVHTDANGVFVVFTGKRELPLSDFRWYGLVPTCVESGSDRGLG